MNIKEQNKARLKIFHLLPSKDRGGAETAAKNCVLIDDEDFIFRTYYINNSEIENKILKKIINEFLNYFKGLKFFLNQHKFVILSSLWKSSILALMVKLLNPKTKIILFLHSSKNSHFLDNFFTSFLFLIANEVWADSKNTLLIRLDELIFKRKNVKTKIVSFVLRRLKPVVYGEKITFNFIYWGRLHKVKNLIQTIKFFNEFYCIDNTSKLTLIGHDYGMKNELKMLIKNLDLQNNVNILEFMDMNKIIEIVKDYSFFIQLSSYEGMAMSVVESMQLGLVPIVTNVGEIGNYCIDSKNSIIFEGFKDTFKKILELRNDSFSYKKISNNAIKTWKNRNLYKEDIYFSCKEFYKENKVYFR